jgi:hypothetical protein
MNFKEYHGYKVYEDGTVIGKFGKPLKPSLNPKGYLHCCIYINGKRKTKGVHRLIAELFLPNYYGKPSVDHIDRNRTNNSLFNLKWASFSEQSLNTKIRSNNTSGVKGVSHHKASKNWYAIININGKQLQKNFKSKEDAIEQRLAWEKEYYLT